MNDEVVVAQESETRLSPEWVEALGRWWEAPELYVEPDLKGYGWDFPKGDVLNVGVGCVSGPGADLPGAAPSSPSHGQASLRAAIASVIPASFSRPGFLSRYRNSTLALSRTLPCAGAHARVSAAAKLARNAGRHEGNPASKA